MFGFGKSIEQFRGQVDIKLNNEYQIVTDSTKNEYFPGIFAYADLIDLCKKGGWNVDESAMHIAVLLYCGFIKKGLLLEGDNLYIQIEKKLQFGLAKGLISKSFWDKNQAIIEREKNKYLNNS